MYRIKIFCPGKTKSKFIREGLAHYTKMLSPFAKVEIIELKEGRGNPQNVIQEESKNIMNALEGDFILLHREGVMLDSLQFAELIKNKSSHQFIIGGAFGVNQTVLNSASVKLSLSSLTFTHELSRLILLEQIYRAITIIHGKKYHY